MQCTAVWLLAQAEPGPARGLEINEGTLYPLLRRLEEQGLLSSQWQLADESRPRRYYVISPHGQAALAHLSVEWRQLSRARGWLANPGGMKDVHTKMDRSVRGGGRPDVA